MKFLIWCLSCSSRLTKKCLVVLTSKQSMTASSSSPPSSIQQVIKKKNKETLIGNKRKLDGSIIKNKRVCNDEKRKTFVNGSSEIDLRGR